MGLVSRIPLSYKLSQRLKTIINNNKNHLWLWTLNDQKNTEEMGRTLMVSLYSLRASSRALVLSFSIILWLSSFWVSGLLPAISKETRTCVPSCLGPLRYSIDRTKKNLSPSQSLSMQHRNSVGIHLPYSSGSRPRWRVQTRVAGTQRSSPLRLVAGRRDCHRL